MIVFVCTIQYFLSVEVSGRKFCCMHCQTTEPRFLAGSLCFASYSCTASYAFSVIDCWTTRIEASSFVLLKV